MLENLKIIMTAFYRAIFASNTATKSISSRPIAAVAMRGFRNGALVKTGDRSYCIVGEWTSLQKLIEARPKMIGILERSATDIGTGLRVTDPGR